MEADALGVLKDFVKLGLGSTILPLPAVHNEIEEGELCAAPIKDPPLSRRLILATPTDRAISNAVLRISDIIQEEVADMVDTNVWVGEPL